MGLTDEPLASERERAGVERAGVERLREAVERARREWERSARLARERDGIVDTQTEDAYSAIDCDPFDSQREHDGMVDTPTEAARCAIDPDAER
ncbi:MAG: hypothetical protein MR874_01060 [Coriobacteriaceae bacterium]|nr:hypothetical protein [Coriobacteriaceae bacterium]MCI6843337.1 hypothetical protein [Coriobacteriaceae bacterium]